MKDTANCGDAFLSDAELLRRGNEGGHYADTPPVQQRTAVSPPYIRPQSISLSQYLQYLSDCVHETHVTILICLVIRFGFDNKFKNT